jgi:hypothetical protein
MAEMKTGVKRSALNYIAAFIWIGLAVGRVWTLYSNKSSTEFYWPWLLVAGVWIAAALDTFIYKYYFQLTDDRTLLRRRGFFITDEIDIDEIKQIRTANSIFKSSKIILKNNSYIKFDSTINKKELQEFMSQFDIPVDQPIPAVTK